MFESRVTKSYKTLKKSLRERYLEGVPKEDAELLGVSFDAWFDESFHDRTIQELKDGKVAWLDLLERIVDAQGSKSVDGKKRYLINDPWMERLEDVSEELFLKAKGRFLDSAPLLSSEQVANYKGKIEESRARVQSFNEKKAEQEYTEAFLDLRYLSDASISETSIRLGRMAGRIERQRSVRQLAKDADLVSPSLGTKRTSFEEGEYERIRDMFCESFLEDVPESDQGLMKSAFLARFDRRNKQKILRQLRAGRYPNVRHLKYEFDFINAQGLEYKKNYVFNDFAFRDLLFISNELFHMAELVKQGSSVVITKAEKKQYEKELSKAFENVQSFHIEAAEHERSEASLDLGFVYYDEDAVCTSFRLSRVSERWMV